jgi:ribosomal protein S18 acetylase RimI-like enzyme
MTLISPIIRPAKIHDAASLAALAERTFRDAFAATNSEADLLLHCAAHYGETLQYAEITAPDLMIYVCEQGSGEATELMGFIQLRQARYPDCVTALRPLEVQKLYVSSFWHGKGVAHDLMAVALDTAANRLADQIWLGVWENNPRAINFYRKYGFAAVGEQTFILGTDSQRDLVMSRPLVLA